MLACFGCSIREAHNYQEYVCIICKARMYPCTAYNSIVLYTYIWLLNFSPFYSCFFFYYIPFLMSCMLVCYTHFFHVHFNCSLHIRPSLSPCTLLLSSKAPPIRRRVNYAVCMYMYVAVALPPIVGHHQSMYMYMYV